MYLLETHYYDAQRKIRITEVVQVWSIFFQLKEINASL